MNNSILKLLSPLWAVITVIAMALTFVIDLGEASTSPDTELIGVNQVYLEKALVTGQGITTDGEYYYTSGAMTALKVTGLAKWKVEDFSLVESKYGVVPQQCSDSYGSNHVGGISYYNGLIYASVENKGKDHPLVITYDCETLEAVNIYDMPIEVLPNGIPWCAVDAQNRFLYCSPFRDVDKIAAFNLDTMEFSHYINLSQGITRIQGGEVYNGKLYLSIDNEDNTDSVYAIDVSTGDTQLLFDRTLPGLAGNESEGMTVYPMADGSLYHIIDYDKAVGIYLRHYAG